jgi:hypothetical protein
LRVGEVVLEERRPILFQALLADERFVPLGREALSLPKSPSQPYLTDSRFKLSLGATLPAEHERRRSCCGK